jgi:hypothetical protein
MVFASFASRVCIMHSTNLVRQSVRRFDLPITIVDDAFSRARRRDSILGAMLTTPRAHGTLEKYFPKSEELPETMLHNPEKFVQLLFRSFLN